MLRNLLEDLTNKRDVTNIPSVSYHDAQCKLSDGLIIKNLVWRQQFNSVSADRNNEKFRLLLKSTKQHFSKMRFLLRWRKLHAFNFTKFLNRLTLRKIIKLNQKLVNRQHSCVPFKNCTGYLEHCQKDFLTMLCLKPWFENIIQPGLSSKLLIF